MATATATLGELQVVIRVIKADLTKNFEAFGRMDPYATVVLQHPEGSQSEVGQTRTEWNAHMNPVWNHTCRSQPHVREDILAISVWEDDVVGKDDLIGSSTTPVAKLIGEANDSGEAVGRIQELPLMNGQEETGKVTVQVMLVRRKPGSTASGTLTRIESELFESPVVRLGVSGGTAPFFSMKLKNPGPKRTTGFYIGKDLSHATDEVMFYEQLKPVIAGTGGQAMAPLLSFCFDYLGILTAPTSDAKKDAKPKDLLVLRNLFDGAKKLRLLDIKIGQKTADAGWQGKSRMAAMRQSFVDGLTNSSAEGFRLEGFDGLPPALSSMDPLLDVAHLTGSGTRKLTADKKKEEDGSKLRKKALRYMLQTLNGAEMLSYFLDCHQEPEDPGEAQLATTRTPAELAEIVCSEIVMRLVRLAISCRLVLVPQKWIGSSVALAYDAGKTPARTVPEAQIREEVKVHIFDWGRSELNSLDSHERLSPKDRQDRGQFWNYYVGGIDRLTFEAVRLYQNRFGNTDEWGSFLCVVSDFDSSFKNDVLGIATIPIQNTPETTLTLTDANGKEMKSMMDKRPPADITYSLQWRAYPTGSRLKGVWRFKVLKARNLPRRDRVMLKGTSDPFVELVATSKDGKRMFKQQTSCKCRNLDPDFDEILEVPVAAIAGVLEATLKTISPMLVKESLDMKLPPEACCCAWAKVQRKSTRKNLDSNNVEDSSSSLSDDVLLRAWQDIMDSAVDKLDTLEPFFQQGTSSNASVAITQEATTPLSTQRTRSAQDMMQELKSQRSAQSLSGEEEVKAVADMEPFVAVEGSCQLPSPGRGGSENLVAVKPIGTGDTVEVENLQIEEKLDGDKKVGLQKAFCCQAPSNEIEGDSQSAQCACSIS